MADTARKMTADEFLVWAEAQEDERFEFVDGVPVAMAGATQAHDQIVVNLIIGLGTRLRGGPCMPRTADQAVKVKADRRVRRPDVLVDCGPRDGKALFVREPKVVCEVLSPSTENVTLSSKLEEYQGLASLAHIVLVDQDKPLIWHYARGGGGKWVKQELAGFDASLQLAAIGAELPLSEIYTDVEFGAAPEV